MTTLNLRRRIRWSHPKSRTVVTLALVSLCLATFLALKVLHERFLEHKTVKLYYDIQAPVSNTRHETNVNHRDLSDRKRLTAHASDPDVVDDLGNRTALPDDCFHGLLRSVDPTCDLGLFCTEAWRHEDVLCRVYLHQAALIPGPAQCALPTGRKETTDDIKSAQSGDLESKTRDLEHEKVKGVVEVVPRVAYYVLVSESCEQPFEFLLLHYISVLSVQRFLKPSAIYVLGNCVPVGYWWSRVLSDITTVRFVRRPRPWITKDGKVKWIAHLADVIRLQVLLVNGGVYLDTDMVLLRPLDPLLSQPLTLGLVDNVTGMGNALILASRGSAFLRDWYSGYRRFKPNHFHYNGMWEAMRLWKKDPGSVHLESRSFYSPNWYEAKLLFESSGYDLSGSYAVHVWHRHGKVPDSPHHFMALNTTLGHVFRRIYLGL